MVRGWIQPGVVCHTLTPVKSDVTVVCVLLHLGAPFVVVEVRGEPDPVLWVYDPHQLAEGHLPGVEQGRLPLDGE